MTVYTREEVRALLETQHWPTVNVWLARGDGIAVYQNVELGHPDAGHCKFVSYGSPAAQLESETPPDRLPDIGNVINWRYWLTGTYRGDPL